MLIDVILDAGDYEIEKFLEHFVERRVISRKRGYATINLAIKSFSTDEIERIINSKIIEFIINRYPELDFGVETKPARSTQAYGAFSLYELVEAFGGDLNLLFLALKFSAFRTGKLRLRKDVADKSIRKLFLEPETKYRILIGLLDKYYPKIIQIATSSIFTGFIPLRDLWKLTYLFTYSGKGLVQRISAEAINSIVDYVKKLKETEKVLPLVLAFKFNTKTKTSESLIDEREVIKELAKKGNLAEALAYITFSQLIFGEKISAIELITSLNVDLKEILNQFINKKSLEPRYIALLAIISLVFSCETLKEFLSENPEVLTNYDYWYCTKQTPIPIELLVDLGSINPVLFREIMKKKEKEQVKKYLKNHLDWSTIIGETPHSRREYAELIKETVIASRDQIVLETTRVQEKEIVFDSVSELVGLSISGDNEILHIISQIGVKKEPSSDLAKYLLNREWMSLIKNENNKLIDLLIKKKEKIKLESKTNIVSSAFESENIKGTWMYFASKLIHEFVMDLEDLQVIKKSLGNKFVQNAFFKSIREMVEYLQIEETKLPLLPSENSISIYLTTREENLVAEVSLLSSEVIQLKPNISKRDYAENLTFLREKIIEDLEKGLRPSLENLREYLGNIESGSKFYIVAPRKINSFTKITLGLSTPTRVIKCREKCEEKPAESLDKREVIFETDDIEGAINALTHGLDLARKYGK